MKAKKHIRITILPEDFGNMRIHKNNFWFPLGNAIKRQLNLHENIKYYIYFEKQKRIHLYSISFMMLMTLGVFSKSGFNVCTVKKGHWNIDIAHAIRKRYKADPQLNTTYYVEVIKEV